MYTGYGKRIWVLSKGSDSWALDKIASGKSVGFHLMAKLILENNVSLFPILNIQSVYGSKRQKDQKIITLMKKGHSLWKHLLDEKIRLPSSDSRSDIWDSKIKKH